MQDEKTGEWRELDTVIDNAAFDALAYMVQKDSPYEEVIDYSERCLFFADKRLGLTKKDFRYGFWERQIVYINFAIL